MTHEVSYNTTAVFEEDRKELRLFGSQGIYKETVYRKAVRKVGAAFR